MELIIKPTGLCNFKCKFCAAANCDIAPVPDFDRLLKVINEIKPATLIFTGGEPTCVDPEFYAKMLKYTDCHISLTSNLKNIIEYPNKWSKLLKNERFGVSTSFNYGGTRMWDENTEYNETMFVNMVHIFEEYAGYVPSFISVIDEYNAWSIPKLLDLAKYLNTTVKLNPCLPEGRSTRIYPKYKMLRHYIDIIDSGMGEYEENCIERGTGRCPNNTSLMCHSQIRCIYLHKDGTLRWNTCEDLVNSGYDMICNETPKDFNDMQFSHKQLNLDKCALLNSEKCKYCALYRMCNACTVTFMNAKKDPHFCEEMSKLKDDLIRVEWKL